MTRKEAYQNFINLNPMSSADFSKAQDFVDNAGLKETFIFNKTIKKIIEQILAKMTLLKTTEIEDVREIYEVYGISKNSIIRRLSIYAANDRDFHEVYHKYKTLITAILRKYYSARSTKDCKYVQRVEAFRNATTLEDIVNVRRQSESFPEEISRYVYIYHIDLDPKAQDALYQELIAKLKESYIKSTALEVLYTDFINSGLSAEEYCLLHNLSFKSFFKRCYLLEDEELKKQVLAKRMSKDHTEIAVLYNELAINIKNGVITDTGIRVFDYIDYYLFLNGRDLPFMPKFYSSFLNRERIICLRNFFAKFRTASFINIDDFINSHIEVNLEKDENGFPISGTGRVLTKEDLENIINYLVINNIPLYDIVINVAIKRYANNTLDISPGQTLS